jgi:hypothetical protein
MTGISRKRPSQRTQLKTSTSNARAISRAHVQFRRGECVAVGRFPGPVGALRTSTAGADASDVAPISAIGDGPTVGSAPYATTAARCRAWEAVTFY